jgi:hypothetical protein
MTILCNVVLGILPAIILGASWAAGTEDTRQHRTMFLLVFGLWALTLAMWDWMRSVHVAWIATWAAAGVVALVAYVLLKRRFLERQL